MKNNRSITKIMAILTVIIMIVPLVSKTYYVSAEQEVVSDYRLSNPRVLEHYRNEKVTWDCIYFGSYYQSSSEFKEPIKWRVLSVEGNDAFLLSDTNLDVMNYDSQWAERTWEECTLRSWLNGYYSTENLEGIDYSENNFIEVAFSKNEQNAIFDTTVINEDNKHGMKGGNNTVDKIFLLSISEIENVSYGFLPSDRENDYDAAKISLNTQYIADGGSHNYETTYIPKAGKKAYWYLRSPGQIAKTIAAINVTVFYGAAIDSRAVSIRPAIHLDLSKTDLWEYAGTVCSDGTVGFPTNTETESKNTTATIDTASATTKNINTAASTSSSKKKIARAKIKYAKNITKKSITIKYSKLANAKKYQIQYALNKKFTKSVKTKSTRKLTYKIKKLKSKKTYYVRVRGINGKIIGKWSKSKKIKVKK